MSLNPWIFTKLMDVITAHMRQCAIKLFPYLDNWLIRDLIRNRLISHNILLSKSSKSRIHSKSKEVRFETSSVIHLQRDGISDTTEYSQGTTRMHLIPSSDYQTISNSESSFSKNFPFSFGQTQCNSRLSCSRQTSFKTASNVSLICLEPSYSTSGSSSSDKQYDPILFEMVDGYQSKRLFREHSSIIQIPMHSF